MKLPDNKIRLYENGVITITPVCRSRGRIRLDADPDSGIKDLKDLGKLKKTWSMDYKTRRKIRSSAIRLYHQKKYSIKFLTLTFSKPVKHEIANVCFSRFVENLVKNYKCNGYVAIRENHQSGVPHYHLLLDIPFTFFSRLNLAWFRACRDFIHYSNCLLRTKKGKTSVIRDISGVSSYVSKYISKTDPEQKFSSRIYFISRGSLSRPMIIDENQLTWLKIKYGFWKTVQKDYFTVIYLYNFQDLPEKIVPGYKKPDPGSRIRIRKKKDPGKNYQLFEKTLVPSMVRA